MRPSSFHHAALCILLLTPTAALADLPSPGEIGSIISEESATAAPLETKYQEGILRLGCAEAELWSKALADPSSDLRKCHAPDAFSSEEAIQTAAQAFQDAARTFYASFGGDTPPADVCAPTALAPNNLAQARKKLLDAQAEEQKLKDRLPPAPPDDLKKAEEATKKAQEQLNQAEQEAKRASKAALQKLDALRAEIQNTLQHLRSSTGFEEMLNAPERRKACMGLYKTLVGLSGSRPETETGEKKLSITDLRNDAHIKDILRKSSPLSSIFSGGGGLLEAVGSPDHVAFSLMSALGADAKTLGTQVVMQLNLANLLYPNDTDRLKLPAATRNLFLRATMPLSATENQPQAGTAKEGTDTTLETSRFSMILGGSLLDESDQRLSTHDDCYELAFAYVPPASFSKDEKATRQERADMADICNRIVARSQRLAWRIGVGMVTVEEKTKIELASGGLVWAPSSWISVNGVYQSLFSPNRLHSFGGGISLGGNLGGKLSGVDAWGRIGIDFLVLGLYTPDGGGHYDWEARFNPTFRVKILDGHFVSLNVGPRVVGSKGRREVLASVSVTSDVDTLINGVMTAPAK